MPNHARDNTARAKDAIDPSFAEDPLSSVWSENAVARRAGGHRTVPARRRPMAQDTTYQRLREIAKHREQLTNQQGATALAMSELAVIMVVVMDFLCSSLQVSVMPFFVTRELGGGATDLGLVVTATAIGVMIGNVWMGMASDRFGRRPVLISSAFFTGLGFFAAALARSTLALAVVRFLHGATSGSLPVATSYLADASAPKDRPRKISQLGGIQGVVFALGPPLGSVIADAAGSLRAVFFVGGAFGWVGMSFAAMYILDRHQVEAAMRASPAARARRRWAALRDMHLSSLEQHGRGVRASGERWWIIGIAVGMAVCTSLVQQTINVVLALGPLHDIGLGQQTFAWVLMAVGVVAALTQLLLFSKVLLPTLGVYLSGVVGALLYWLSQLAWMRVGHDAHGCVGEGGDASQCVVGRASAADLVALSVGTGFFGMGYVLSVAVVSPVLVQSSSSKRRGFVVGLGSAGAAFGRAIGPSLFGVEMSLGSSTFAFQTACGVCGMMSAMWLVAWQLGQETKQSARTKFIDVVQQAVARHHEQLHEDVLEALKDELEGILRRHGYSLIKPHAFETISESLNVALIPEDFGAGGRIGRRAHPSHAAVGVAGPDAQLAQQARGASSLTLAVGLAPGGSLGESSPVPGASADVNPSRRTPDTRGIEDFVSNREFAFGTGYHFRTPPPNGRVARGFWSRKSAASVRVRAAPD